MLDAYIEYNVAFRNQSDDLQLSFATWTQKEQALKRLAKLQKQGGCVRWIRTPDGEWSSERAEPLLVRRTISAPEVVEP